MSYDNLRKAVRHREDSYNNNVKTSSSERLKTIVVKKIMTTLIGGIARVEEEIGYLWGHSLHEEECTEDQLDMRQAWYRAREKMLDNGNKQIRALDREFPRYTITWNKYNQIFRKGADND